MGEGLLKAARGARSAALAGLRAAGGFDWLARSAWRRRRLSILCYHGVSLADEHEWDNRLFASPAFLRRRFEILRDGRYNVLPLGEACARLRDDSLPDRAVVITFDDGLHDFHSRAMPLLEEFGFPATNYISTYFCLHQVPVPFVTARYMLWRARNRVLPARTFEGQETPVDLGDPAAREQLVSRLLRDPRIAAGGAPAEQAQLQEIAARLGIDWDALQSSKLFHLMTPAEVADAARRGFDIQLHTHRHRTPRDKDAFFREVLENRRCIEEMTGRRTTHFCYPSGDVDAIFLPWLREMQVETGTTTALPGLAESRHDPLLLPRFVDTMAQSELVFESWLAGAGALLARRAA